MISKLRNNYQIILCIFASLILFIDIGNIDGLRQGTEGFYLQISKEMFELNSFLVPKYLGENHWSKPPLHFWTAFPFYYLTGSPSLIASRISVLFITLISILIISNWCSKNLNYPKYVFFIFLISTIGILKYSRIFMMEIPLTFYSVISVLYAHTFFKTNRSSNFFISIFFAACSCMIKGPVSLVMIYGSIGLFNLYHSGPRFLLNKNLYIFGISSLLLSSIWFLLCFQRFGPEFFDYFFIRENVGKFKSKSYPVSSVIQGLIIFSLPWSIILVTKLKKLKLNFKGSDYKFLLISFCVFFFLWFIPKQKSHHYAMPSIPLFLIYIFPNIQQNFTSKNWFRNLIFYIPFLFAIFIFVLSFFIDNLPLKFDFNFYTVCTVLLFALALFIFNNYKNLFSFALSFHILMVTIWALFIPNLYLPMLPQRAVDLINQQQLTVVTKKPYFISERINREVIVSDASRIKEQLQSNTDGLILVHEDTYKSKNLSSDSTQIYSWIIWKRGRKSKEILKAILNLNVEDLLDRVYLLRPLNH